MLARPTECQMRGDGSQRHRRKLADPLCRSLWILFMVVLTLSVSPKHALNSSIKASKSSTNGDFCSNNGANQDKVEPLNKVPTSPTRDA